MFNIKKQLIDGKKFTGDAIKYIYDVPPKDNYISNTTKNSIVDRVYKRGD